ncbi:MAG: amino acid-binding protein [Desulfobacteraceae bacterium IS3]|nr:MAG: amino acid-binding protein [Desulfobacteraceae bacterium IS3]
MKLKQISIAIENSPGRLFEVTNALGEAGINLRALNLVDTGAFGQLRLLVSDIAAARRILMEKHIAARVDDVLAAEIEDKPGSLAKILKPLMEAKINVLYTYAFVGSSSGKAVMIFRFSDNDNAIETLQKNGIKLLDAESFGILETET